MTKQETLELIHQLREMGAESIEVNGVKVNFTNTPQKASLNKDDVPEDELVAKPSPFDQLTDEEILFWSTDYGTELESKRRLEHDESILRQKEKEERSANNGQ